MDDPNINAAFAIEEGMVPVDKWILERYENCLRIATQKTDKADVMSWLEDAAYFHRTLLELKRITAVREVIEEMRSEVKSATTPIVHEAATLHWARKLSVIIGGQP